LRHLRRNSCTLHFCRRLLCVRLVNRILLSGERSRLAQPWTALPLRPGGNAGISLLLRQHGAIIMRDGAETDPDLELVRCARVLGSDPTAPVLFIAPQQVVHPVAAPATPQGGVKTSSFGPAEPAAAAPVASQLVALLDHPLKFGTVCHACLDCWLFDVHHRSPAGLAHASATRSP
jgi:hypothetical protein